jgi:hypothetical protein
VIGTRSDFKVMIRPSFRRSNLRPRGGRRREPGRKADRRSNETTSPPRQGTLKPEPGSLARRAYRWPHRLLSERVSCHRPWRSRWAQPYRCHPGRASLRASRVPMPARLEHRPYQCDMAAQPAQRVHPPPPVPHLAPAPDPIHSQDRPRPARDHNRRARR